MTLLAFQGAVELGLVYSLVALGLFVSFRVLGVADLTVDGSFTLGAAVTAVYAANGQPLTGMALALLAGAGAGFITAQLQTRCGVQPILSGIVTMTALYSINIRVMGGRSNIPLLGKTTLFTYFEQWAGPELYRLAALLLCVAVVALVLILFLATPLGLSVRATGDNPDMVSSSSINPAFTKTVGLCIANATVALSGSLLAQYQQSTDISMGIGTVVIGLASLIIGEVLLGQRSIPLHVAAVVAGAAIYRIIIAFALRAAISPSDLKLVSALIVAAAISYPAVRERIAFHRLRKAGEQDADR